MLVGDELFGEWKQLRPAIVLDSALYAEEVAPKAWIWIMQDLLVTTRGRGIVKTGVMP